MAHLPKGRILEEIMFGIKVDTGEREQIEPADSSKASNLHVQVPQEGNCTEPRNLDPVKVQLDIKPEDQHPSVSFMLEKLPASKSRLSPLAARAALASLVSTACDEGANGTIIDDHQIMKNLSTMDNCSLKDPCTLVPIAREAEYLVKKLLIDEHHFSLELQLEESTELNASARSKHSTIERKSIMFAETGRVTHSSIQKANGFAMDAEDIQRNRYMDSEGCTLPSGLKDETNLTFKEVEKDANLIQITESCDSKRNGPKKSALTNKQEQESSEMEVGIYAPAQEVGVQTSSVTVGNKPAEEKAKYKSVKRKLVELQIPGRVTRSAVQKAIENADSSVQGKCCDEEVQERFSKTMRRSVRSTGLEKAENFTGSQGLDKDNFVQGTKSDNSEMSTSEEECVPAQKKETISLHMASVEQTPARESFKAEKSSSSKMAHQTEGKHAGGITTSREQNKKSSFNKKNKKSTSDSKQERKFSHRLRFLPQTRSQVKS